MRRCESDFIKSAGMTYGELVAYRNPGPGQPKRNLRQPCPCSDPECKQEFLVWCGKKTKPKDHLRIDKPGLKKLERAGKACGMTAEHATAQAIVLNTLKNGEAMRVQVECARAGRDGAARTCKQKFEHLIQLQEGEECTTEACFRNSDSGHNNWADVGIRKVGAPKDETGLVCVIEVYHKSSTPECNRRNIAQWFEVKAADVIADYEAHSHRKGYVLSVDCCRMLKACVVCDECQARDVRLKRQHQLRLMHEVVSAIKGYVQDPVKRWWHKTEKAIEARQKEEQRLARLKRLEEEKVKREEEMRAQYELEKAMNLQAHRRGLMMTAVNAMLANYQYLWMLMNQWFELKRMRVNRNSLSRKMKRSGNVSGRKSANAGNVLNGKCHLLTILNKCIICCMPLTRFRVVSFLLYANPGEWSYGR